MGRSFSLARLTYHLIKRMTSQIASDAESSFTVVIGKRICDCISLTAVGL
jgi:hypothetical protein